MSLTIKYNTSKELRDDGNPINQITIIKEGIEIAVDDNGYYFAVAGKYYYVADKYAYSDFYNYSIEVADTEPEFKEYIQDRVIERDRANR